MKCWGMESNFLDSNWFVFYIILAIVCPIKGQVFQQCRVCPATCGNPNPICTLECRPGCGCPPGQVIDEANNRCVPRDQCSGVHKNLCVRLK